MRAADIVRGKDPSLKTLKPESGTAGRTVAARQAVSGGETDERSTEAVATVSPVSPAPFIAERRKTADVKDPGEGDPSRTAETLPQREENIPQPAGTADPRPRIVRLQGQPSDQPFASINEVYLNAQDCLYDLRDKLRRNERISIQSAINVIQGVIALHDDHNAEMYQMAVDYGHGDDYNVSHAVNTAIYALRIGRSLGYSPSELQELGLAALLCDIGMFKIPDSLLNKQGTLSEEEISIVRQHPQFSRDILAPFKKDYPALVEAVFQHQERENGQGYPSGLKDDEISEYAKIIGICDSYEAMTHHRPHKKALMQTESIRELIGTKNQLFSPRIIKAFLDEISIFPIGSYVRLNNKNIGRIVATNRSNPLKPTIKILYDENGRRFTEPKIIEMKTNPVLSIEGSIALDELPR